MEKREIVALLEALCDRLLGAVAHGDGDRDQAVLAREQARAAGQRKQRFTTFASARGATG